MAHRSCFAFTLKIEAMIPIPLNSWVSGLDSPSVPHISLKSWEMEGRGFPAERPKQGCDEADIDEENVHVGDRRGSVNEGKDLESTSTGNAIDRVKRWPHLLPKICSKFNAALHLRHLYLSRTPSSPLRGRRLVEILGQFEVGFRSAFSQDL